MAHRAERPHRRRDRGARPAVVSGQTRVELLAECVTRETVARLEHTWRSLLMLAADAVVVAAGLRAVRVGLSEPPSG